MPAYILRQLAGPSCRSLLAQCAYDRPRGGAAALAFRPAYRHKPRLALGRAGHRLGCCSEIVSDPETHGVERVVVEINTGVAGAGKTGAAWRAGRRRQRNVLAVVAEVGET